MSEKRRRHKDRNLSPEHLRFLRHIYEEGDQAGEWNAWFEQNEKVLSQILEPNDLECLAYRLSDTILKLLRQHNICPRDFADLDVTTVPEVSEMLERNLTCVLLCPQKKSPADLRSRMGGQPCGLPKWPSCPTCGVPMNFVLQLFRDEFPQMYFPENRDIFLLFRCPDAHCCDEDNCSSYDRTTVWFYVGAAGATEQPVRPSGPAADKYWEKQISEYLFQPVEAADHPSFADACEEWWGEQFTAFADMWSGSPVYDKFFQRLTNQDGTKIGGFPSWRQRPDFPVCDCGRKKTFFFQLASFYPEAHVRGKRFSEMEKISIDDAGNIYFFRCEACGAESIETRWDCG